MNSWPKIESGPDESGQPAARKNAMKRPSCPRCQSLEVIAGDCVGESLINWSFWTRTLILSWFIPARTRFFRWAMGVSFTRGFAACLSCGHVWGAVDPAALRSFVAQYCDEVVPPADDEVDRRLADLAAKAMEHLPDTKAGREIAAILAALDRLVSSGKAADLPKRYRALTGATWEEAARVTREWQYRTREEKLQRLGRVEKKGPLDDLAEPLL